jgi:hypothetical protein
LHLQPEISNSRRRGRRDIQLPFGDLEAWRRDPHGVGTGLRLVEPISALAVGDDRTNHAAGARELDRRAR